MNSATVLLLGAGAGTAAAALEIMGTEAESNILDASKDKDTLSSDVVLVSDGDGIMELRVELETASLVVSGNDVSCSPAVS
jgi:hypothetical protein